MELQLESSRIAKKSLVEYFEESVGIRGKIPEAKSSLILG